MKVLNAEQIRTCDQFTIENEPIASIDLMERASQSCFDWISNNFDTSYSLHVVCGMGNNGGDGLALARLLIDAGYNCSVSVVRLSEKGSPDFEVNLDRLNTMGIEVQWCDTSINFESNDIVIDALFGSGLSRPLENNLKSIVEAINHQSGLVISIDVPSGLFMEDNSANAGAIVQADFTLTFETPKLSFLLPSSGTFAGNWRLLDIGLNKSFQDAQESNYHYITKPEIEAALVDFGRFAHKGTFGHALLIAGSYGKAGAAVLSARSCLRSGVGLLTTYIPQSAYPIMQTAVPEAMCMTSDDEKIVSGVPDLSSFKSIGIGPGIGTDKRTQGTFKVLIQEAKLPIVLDADALNILGENKTWLDYLPAGSILTPHPGEFRRLVGDFKSDVERLAGLQQFAQRYKVIVVLKGAHTAIASPDGNIYFNSTGNPGMATAGSGDVLTGVITSFLAQGYNPVIAACLGVYFHGLAGDLAAQNLGERGMIASDLIDFLPRALENE